MIRTSISLYRIRFPVALYLVVVSVLCRDRTTLDTVLNQSESAMVLITHDLGLAARRVNRLMVMDNGRIAEDAATNELLQNQLTPAATALVQDRSWISLPCEKRYSGQLITCR